MPIYSRPEGNWQVFLLEWGWSILNQRPWGEYTTSASLSSEDLQVSYPPATRQNYAIVVLLGSICGQV
ncbi:hypothetical protein A2875_03770 [Candidatus Gottesmanbacteria bacterium RIFCSPHIGHO2_01_FULL_46_14]|uniref:Uncharacterized protein n=1 Tax=Candidatus Gottesmanbacteria bacterium RIFCSPHIGHO2_01_FULL_46_14 TaxID=1798380 RepID=A0A1F5ZMY7_9BACT|nr:MAG: hypothetical protein A2875_03770 [Candidatus Gottesmanbacteria bacterium RIFCSPHIGHO2_01_FULL_46_14]